MSKNVRISLYILIPVIIWMISGQFVQESEQEEKIKDELTSVVVSKSESVFFLCFFFFFQAEDGIRDFCLSRGLGDVYKRQASIVVDPTASTYALTVVVPSDTTIV